MKTRILLTAIHAAGLPAACAGPEDLVYLTHRLADGSSEEWYSRK